jgi:hypothetical protein
MMSVDIAKELSLIHDRLNAQNSTMQAMWQRLQPMTKFYDWAMETHPELLEQYASIQELEALGKTDRSVAMKGYAQAIPKTSGQPVSYGDGNL